MAANSVIYFQTFLWLQVANISISRGKIIDYKLEVYNQNSVLKSVNISGDARNYSVPFCANCEVKVWARNSKGLSPPANITLSHTKGKNNKSYEYCF